MQDFAALSLEEFLDQTADRTPTPGGGSVTGMAGALSCAMANMVAAYSVGKKTDPQKKTRVETVAVQLHRADQLLRALITQDAVAYSAMTQAAKAAKGDDAAAYQDAVLSALSVPVEMAALASHTLTTLDEFKQDASRYLLSDLGISAVLAEATARAARYTVLVNVAELADPAQRRKLLGEMDVVLAHCSSHRESIEAFVTAHLEAPASSGR
jgi:formiminotetrahydrofolate cyclodeaminase